MLTIAWGGTHDSSHLRVPAPTDQVVVDDDVPPFDTDDLPVAATQRLLCPPAILHQPRLAHDLDGLAVDHQGLPLMSVPAIPRAHADGPGAVQDTRRSRLRAHADHP